GFIGATAEGITTTLGRGGSDFSAALVGACLDAREIQIWTDVDGLLAADPRIVPDPAVVPQVSFAEARELAYFGAKVLHPSTVEPAVARGIPVRILNSRRPGSTGTVVNGASAPDRLAPAALACKRRVTVLEIASRRTLRPPVFLRRVFEILDGAALHPCVTTIADTIVVAAFDNDARAGQLTAAFAEVADVTVRGEMALLSAVGDGLRGTPRLAADVLAALEGVAVHAVAQPPSGRSLTMLLDDADLADAMRRVYDRFYAPATADRTAPVAARG
ncbi:MAG: ACT domain-containing protein, partial [Vicinamibacterales bacterium]